MACSEVDGMAHITQGRTSFDPITFQPSESCQIYHARGRLKISRNAEVQTRRPPNGKEESVLEL